MSRISIDVTDAQHKQLKALAALQGKTIKEFVLASTLGSEKASEDLAELEALLDQRIAETEAKGVSEKTVGNIFEEERKAAAGGPDV